MLLSKTTTTFVGALFGRGFACPTLLQQSLRAFAAGDLSAELRKRIQGCVSSAPVVVFMKGTQQEPMCGFSKNVKMVLDFHQIKFKDFNVLEDEDLRNGIKVFSDWPTIPQVFVNGNFIGGCDIMIQMHQDGEITDFFEQHGIRSRFSDQQQSSSETNQQQ